MSGFLGILGATEALARVRGAARHLQRRGAGSLLEAESDHAAVVHLDFGPPLGTLHRDGLWLAWDGRLDAPGELARQLGLSIQNPKALSLEGEAAAWLVSRAFLHWGEPFAERLRGDFALALLQLSSHRLLLARDGCGTRPLFFHRSPKELIFGSTLDAVRTAGRLASDLNEEWLAAYFTRSLSAHHTPYRSIQAVEPGQTLVFEGGNCRSERWFRPRPVQSLPDLDDPEAEALFLDAFRTAVGRRMVGNTVAVDLSGGLDSSAIAALAHDLAARGDVAATPVTVSLLYRRSPTADERRYIDLVQASLGRESIHLEQDDYPIFLDAEQPFFEVPGMKVCLRAREEAMVERLRRADARVQLRGVGGDHLLISEVDVPFHLADLLRSGRWRQMFGHAGELARGQGRAMGELLWRGIVETSLPVNLRARWQKRSTNLPAWLRPAWRQRLNLDRRLLWERRVAEVGPPSMQDRVAHLEHAIQIAGWAYDRGPRALDVAYPYLDRDLIELCLALPYRQLVRGVETRSILRRALRPLLPPEIVERRSKASPHEAYARAIASSWPTLDRLCSSLRLADLGIVNPVRLRQSLEAMRFGMPSEPMALQVLGIELWLRSRERTPTTGE